MKIQKLFPHRLSVANAISLFSSLSLLTFGIIILIIISFQVKQDITHQEKHHIKRAVSDMVKETVRFLKVKEALMKNQTSSRALIGLLSKPYTQQAIKQFFLHTSVIGKTELETLLSPDGNIIYRHPTSLYLNYRDMPWFSSFLQGRKIRYTGIIMYQNHPYWQIATSIHQGTRRLGVLVLELPLSTTSQLLEFQHRLKGGQLTIYSKGKKIAQYGSSQATGASETMYSPELNLVFHYQADPNSVLRESGKIIFHLILGLSFAILVVTLIALRMGRHFFAKPLEDLQQRVISIGQEGHYEKVHLKYPIIELHKLALQFNHMAQRIRARESSLKEANLQLSKNQAQLVQSEKMAALGTMAAGIAHEINNPIGYIKSNISLLEQYLTDINEMLLQYEQLKLAIERKENAETLKPILSTIDDTFRDLDLAFRVHDLEALIKETIAGTEHVTSIVNGLRQFAHPDDEEHVLADINEGIELTLKIIWNELKNKCHVEKTLAPLPKVYCIPGQINQVIMNLLMNAVQAIEEHGEIFICTGQKEDTIYIRIEDTGCGIPEEKLNRLFSPFYTTKPIGIGTGLGLSISYGIIEKHHGHIEVHSKEGIGTTFTVYLPLSTHK